MQTTTEPRLATTRSANRVPLHLVAGLLLIAVAWPTAWFGPAPISEYYFFPLWLGYILTVDGITLWRTGTSLLTRSRSRFVLLFVYSAPLWWLFEGANQALGNWRYQVPRDYGALTYTALATLSFSTVIPAIFVTAELYRSIPFFARERRWIRIAPSRRGLLGISAAGGIMFGLSIAIPQYAFPLVWIGAFLLVDPLNKLFGAKSLAAEVARRRWDTVLVLFAAGLTCGFFWEMWNINANPKWVYDVPYLNWPKLFEMPLLGYGGYLPFALEVYAIYNLLVLLTLRNRDPYLTFDRPNGTRTED